MNYDFRILVFTVRMVQSGALDLFSGIVWILRSEPITFGIDTAACKSLVPSSHPVFDPQGLSIRMRVQHRGKVYDQGKRILFTLDTSGNPMVIESRKDVDGCHRDDRLWTMGLFWATVSALIQEQGKNMDFTPTPGGWDLTLTLEPPEKANKVLNKANREISARKQAHVEAHVEARNNGAITDTEMLENITGCDPFRRLGISL